MERMNPAGIAPPLSRYSHAVLVPAGARTLHVSGQVGVRPDGTLAEGAEAQLEQSWQNVMAILAAAGMGAQDIVKVNTFLVPAVDVGLSREVRGRHLQGAAPASTLLVVAGLASPAYLCEIEVVAAVA
jgi:enamine deaminase RidA (YjgF/YER057c/UK114 family)